MVFIDTGKQNKLKITQGTNNFSQEQTTVVSLTDVSSIRIQKMRVIYSHFFVEPPLYYKPKSSDI